MDLSRYLDESVRITDKDGMVFTGKVNDYIWPEDNENGKESIIIDRSNGLSPYEFYEDDIAKIEIL